MHISFHEKHCRISEESVGVELIWTRLYSQKLSASEYNPRPAISDIMWISSPDPAIVVAEKRDKLIKSVMVVTETVFGMLIRHSGDNWNTMTHFVSLFTCV